MEQSNWLVAFHLCMLCIATKSNRLPYLILHPLQLSPFLKRDEIRWRYLVPIRGNFQYIHTHLKEEDDHGEGEARDGADEDSADGAETDAVRVIQHGAVVLEVGRPVTSC